MTDDCKAVNCKLTKVSVAAVAGAAYFCQAMADTDSEARKHEYWSRIEMGLSARGRKQHWLETELARVSGTTSRGKLSNLKKRGSVQIDIATAEQIAKLLDVDACWLVLGRGEMGHYVEREWPSSGSEDRPRSRHTERENAERVRELGRRLRWDPDEEEAVITGIAAYSGTITDEEIVARHKELFGKKRAPKIAPTIVTNDDFNGGIGAVPKLPKRAKPASTVDEEPESKPSTKIIERRRR